MKRFPKQRVFITGAASGFGKALAIEFAKEGWKVAVSDIDEQGLQKTVADVDQAGGEGFGFRCDVTKPDALDEAAEKIRNKWGGVDIVINNAGIAGGGKMEEISLESWQRILDINLWSVIYGCRTFIPMLREQGGGYIVNVASSAGILSAPEMSNYNVTKAAVISLSETLRAELAQDNIGVTAVAPTFFRTNLVDNSARDASSEKAFGFFKEAMMSSKYTSDVIARHTLRAIDRNRLYVIPQGDGKLNWWIKRLAPNFFNSLFGWLYKRKLYVFKHFQD